MDRRRFLARLGLSAAGLAVGGLELDLDRLLWVPGAKTIFLPPVPVVEAWPIRRLMPLDWVTREALQVLENQLTFTRYVNRAYDERFIDHTTHVRLPRRFA